MPWNIFHALQTLILCVLVTNKYELLGNAIGIFLMRCKRLFYSYSLQTSTSDWVIQLEYFSCVANACLFVLATNKYELLQFTNAIGITAIGTAAASSQ
jgi:hypothetical protein